MKHLPILYIPNHNVVLGKVVVLLIWCSACVNFKKNLESTGYHYTWLSSTLPKLSTLYRDQLSGLCWKSSVCHIKCARSSDPFMMVCLPKLFMVANFLKLLLLRMEQSMCSCFLVFALYFAVMLEHALQGNCFGIPVSFRASGELFNIRWFTAKTKTTTELICDLLLADDVSARLILSSLQRQED